MNSFLDLQQPPSGAEELARVAAITRFAIGLGLVAMLFRQTGVWFFALPPLTYASSWSSPA